MKEDDPIPVSPPTLSSPRAMYLDAYRGLLIVFMFLVSSRSPISQFRHVHWDGFHVGDLVYGGFLFVVGISLYFSSFAAEKRQLTRFRVRKKLIARSFRLFAVGVALTSLASWDARLSLGTLQCIALVILLSSIFVSQGPKTLLGSVVLLYLLLIAGEKYFSLGVGNEWEESFTLSERLDILFLGKPKGEEGVISTLASLSFSLLGLFIARLFVPGKEKLRLVFLLGILFILFGWALQLSGVLVSPRLVTPSFSLIASGICVLGLLMFFILVERLALRSWFAPLSIYGQNALGAYVFVKLLHVFVFSWPVWHSELGDLTARELLITAVRNYCGWQLGDIIYPLTKVMCGWLFCFFLSRRKIFLKL